MFKTIAMAVVLFAAATAADDNVQFAMIKFCGNVDHNPLGFGTIAWTADACVPFVEGLHVKADCTTNELKYYNSSTCAHELGSETFDCNKIGFSVECGTAPENTVGTMLMYDEDDCSDTPNLRYFVTDTCIQQNDDDDDDKLVPRASPTSMSVACEDKKIVVSVFTESASCTGTATTFNVPANECLDLNTVFPSDDDDDDDYDDDDDHPFMADKMVANRRTAGLSYSACVYTHTPKPPDEDPSRVPLPVCSYGKLMRIYRTSASLTNESLSLSLSLKLSLSFSLSLSLSSSLSLSLKLSLSLSQALSLSLSLSLSPPPPLSLTHTLPISMSSSKAKAAWIVVLAMFATTTQATRFASISSCDGDDDGMWNFVLNPIGFGNMVISSDHCLPLGRTSAKINCDTNQFTVYNDTTCTKSMGSQSLNSCMGETFKFSCVEAPENTVGTMLIYPTNDCSGNPPMRIFVEDGCQAPPSPFDFDDDKSVFGPAGISFQLTCTEDSMTLRTHTSSDKCQGASVSSPLVMNECISLTDLAPVGGDDDFDDDDNDLFNFDDDFDDFDDDDDFMHNQSIIHIGNDLFDFDDDFTHLFSDDDDSQHGLSVAKIVLKCGADTTVDGSSINSPLGNNMNVDTLKLSLSLSKLSLSNSLKLSQTLSLKLSQTLSNSLKLSQLSLSLSLSLSLVSEPILVLALASRVDEGPLLGWLAGWLAGEFGCLEAFGMTEASDHVVAVGAGHLAIPPGLFAPRAPVHVIGAHDQQDPKSQAVFQGLVEANQRPKAALEYRFKSVTDQLFPPRKEKAAPTQSVTEEAHIPDGIIKRHWISRHAEEIPAVIVIFMALEWEAEDWNKREEEYAQMVAAIRPDLLRCVLTSSIPHVAISEALGPLVSSPFSSKIAANKKSPMVSQRRSALIRGTHRRHHATLINAIAPEIITARASSLRNKCQLLRQKELYILDSPMQRVVHDLIKLESVFMELCGQHYQAEIARVTARREAVHETTERELLARYAFKIGFFNELMQDYPKATAAYTQCVRELQQLTPLSGREFELAYIFSLLNIKWPLTFVHSYLQFGLVFEKAVASGLQPIMTEHPGLYFQQAADHEHQRMTLLAQHGQQPTDITATETTSMFLGQIQVAEQSTLNVTDTSILTALEHQVPHAAHQQVLLERALAHFERYAVVHRVVGKEGAREPQTVYRTIAGLKCRLAHAFMALHRYDKALKCWEEVLAIQWREPWFALLAEYEVHALRCAFALGDGVQYCQRSLACLDGRLPLETSQRGAILNHLIEWLNTGVTTGFDDACANLDPAWEADGPVLDVHAAEPAAIRCKCSALLGATGTTADLLVLLNSSLPASLTLSSLTVELEACDGKRQKRVADAPVLTAGVTEPIQLNAGSTLRLNVPVHRAPDAAHIQYAVKRIQAVVSSSRHQLTVDWNFATGKARGEQPLPLATEVQALPFSRVVNRTHLAFVSTKELATVTLSPPAHDATEEAADDEVLRTVDMGLIKAQGEFATRVFLDCPSVTPGRELSARLTYMHGSDSHRQHSEATLVVIAPFALAANLQDLNGRLVSLAEPLPCHDDLRLAYELQCCSKTPLELRGAEVQPGIKSDGLQILAGQSALNIDEGACELYHEGDAFAEQLIFSLRREVVEPTTLGTVVATWLRPGCERRNTLRLELPEIVAQEMRLRAHVQAPSTCRSGETVKVELVVRARSGYIEEAELLMEQTPDFMLAGDPNQVLRILPGAAGQEAMSQVRFDLLPLTTGQLKLPSVTLVDGRKGQLTAGVCVRACVEFRRLCQSREANKRTSAPSNNSIDLSPKLP
ncbi:uncharacterized protein MONBRDRAFT_33306 [Monosiga brevicollis MX1]|uniref:Trafficking protein particle complex subunit 11 domain-containing protein n=1 Tax=Monosiga brevicollis TaxID=81824 RepID=A9V4M9_MONBE|nr:uncharacterized protein MONBRDRAFT_33306 [Monosiga brevicollis MX1]EDQ87481.1 predicted protein [Monosiga brevicollis MX1]|eukprot:XP_001747741.1 hypothetical protein [Monosiga brevicollis MX1]